MNFVRALDAEILERLREILLSPLGDTVLFAVFVSSFLGLCWALLSVIFIFRKNTRFICYGILIALALGFAFSAGLSCLPQRTEPPMGTSEIALLLADFPVRFPSFSTVMAFSSLVVLIHHVRHLSAVFIVLACFVPLSHLYFSICYPMDVIASIISGLLCGYFAERIVIRIAPSGVKVK